MKKLIISFVLLLASCGSHSETKYGKPEYMFSTEGMKPGVYRVAIGVENNFFYFVVPKSSEKSVVDRVKEAQNRTDSIIQDGEMRKNAIMNKALTLPDGTMKQERDYKLAMYVALNKASPEAKKKILSDKTNLWIKNTSTDINKLDWK